MTNEARKLDKGLVTRVVISLTGDGASAVAPAAALRRQRSSTTRVRGGRCTAETWAGLAQEARNPMQTNIGLLFEVVGLQVPFATDREDVVAHRVPICPGTAREATRLPHSSATSLRPVRAQLAAPSP